MAEKSPLKRNFAVLLLAQVYTQGLAALNGLLVVRFLGPAEYGRYALAVAGLNLGAVVADAGLSAYLGREAARQPPEQAIPLLKLALRVRLGLSLLVGLALLGLTALWPPIGEPGLALLAALSLFPLAISILITAFLNGQGRVPLSAGLNALGGTLSFGLVLAGLIWQPLAAVVLLASFAASLISAALFIRPVLLNFPTSQNEQLPLTSLSLLKAGQSFFYIGLASILFQYADLYLVSLWLNKEAVGQYGAALRLLALVTTIPTVWGIAAVPRFARQPRRLRAELLRWGWLLAAGGMGLALVGLLVAGPLVHLILGPRYAAAGRILGLMLWAGAAIFASAAPVTWLTVTNRQRYILLALVGGDLLSLCLTSLFTGLLQWNLEGAALARIASTWGVFGLYLLFCRPPKRFQED